MTGIPEQPDRGSADPLMEEVAAARRWVAGATEAEMERARANRYWAELEAAIFVLAVIRRAHPAAVRAAVEMARTEPGITVPAWMDAWRGEIREERIAGGAA